MIGFRPGTVDDALCVGVLATQVFLDTYASGGIRPDLAREVLGSYTPEAFAPRLADPALRFLLAERNQHLVGFAEVGIAHPCPLPEVESRVELVRLYVQPPFQGCGIGRELLRRAEDIAAAEQARALWLAAWAGNDKALGFYRGCGFRDAGSLSHVIEGQAYENRGLFKPCETP